MLLATVFTVALLGAADQPLYEAEMIFPPEKFHNHSSTIVETPKGDLIAAWFHGQGERHDDTLVISGARKKKGATGWSAPFLMADNKNLPDQNPVLFIDPNKTLWLFWISTMDNEVQSYFLKYRTAVDYEGEGAPKWAWQDAIFCRPQDLEKTVLSEIEKVVTERGPALQQNPSVKQGFEKMKTMASDKLFQRLGWMPRQPPLMLSDKRMMLGLYSDVLTVRSRPLRKMAGRPGSSANP